ncbi:MAG: helix-turn-helix domain-containing protein [Leptospirillum sp.]
MIEPSILSTTRRSLDSSDEIVQVLTRSEELFAKIVEMGQVSPYRHFRRTGSEEESVPGGVMLVDTGTMEIIGRKLNSGEGVLVLGKGDALLQQWKKFLDLRMSGECSPEGFEEFLRLRVRQALQRSCTWPGGAYDFFQGILSSVLISEALDLTGGNRQKTAQVLGISRTTLRNRMQEKSELK